MTVSSPNVLVVGGGISGLVAAYRLRQQLGDGARITLAEGAGRLGGKLRTDLLAGEPLDLGAEAFIARRPEVPALLTELGLTEQLVHPAGLRPLIWSQDSLHPLPQNTLMGIPARPEDLAGLVDHGTLARIGEESELPLRWVPGSDVAVGSLVGERFGEQVVWRSVDPLLGGVYSGLADTIGVRAALPTLAAALDRGAASLSAAVAAALPPPSAGPVFGALRDGYGVLLDALAAAAHAHVVHEQIRTITRESGGWSADPVGLVDGIVLAVPAPQLADLLAAIAPGAAAAAGRIPLASSAVVALALPAAADLPQNSGILVAADASLAAKAFTLSSRKWPHLAGRDVAVVRASFGRFGDAGIVDAPDADLVAAARRDLGTVTGVTDEPVAARVQRWYGGLPQYGPGHLDRVAEIERDIAGLDGVEVSGALLHGVGVPACVASATTAATRLAERVAR
ncbi:MULTISPECIES: protoporphyrinogen oxidase [Rhodococcus]|uniref:Protoporphyrinogen oxidase n=1 Tax=Rhodococcus oxybenzonivorans TaxID=1990687 RepID=A0AAE4UZ54_9NOCA|nr:MULTISPECIES: protoporphyrinogen oxidase [Rhodococcus]MDV7245014.1 protoporphyrinogen oxidase [Rhodococcus oxybenzonivorans]MDV7265663.1 protoporphyrinogen oxidase [Rhodococcus oxybenzonivorans]MDV7278248.1 protoporphyrinogen oxidase [Rhodococcus oxybenzonivorans]MDV7332264.1 protoporphyrinogen oxidase [Rhodococcus oxybenzonivorans]MDV7347905.1 protoporphyrinogen oxidase [Rhodococcus oxybenzonivorans]